MLPFDFQLRTRIVSGPDRLDSIGRLACELGARRVLLVSDPGIVAVGHAGRTIESLDSAGIETALFDRVVENPTTDTVDEGLRFVREMKYPPELIIGLGGGSSMDCAKGINFLFSCGGEMKDYWGVGKATAPLLPMIAIPTTAGTGSEAQSFALISDATTHVKMACGDKKAACRVALLDPKLTLTQPPRVTALTGIDAIAHAVETYVTTRRSAISIGLSREAWRLVSHNFPLVVATPGDLDSRWGMQVGSCLAGLAIENSMLGAAHALANPLTARYGIVHGQAIALVLPHVVRFNGSGVEDFYRELCESSTAAVRDMLPSGETAADRLAGLLADFVERSGLSSRLSQCGVEEQALPDLAQEAAAQWTAGFNPLKVEQAELLAIYRSAY